MTNSTRIAFERLTGSTRHLINNPTMESCHICVGRPDLAGKVATLVPESGGEIRVSITPTLSRFVLCKAGDAVFPACHQKPIQHMNRPTSKP